MPAAKAGGMTSGFDKILNPGKLKKFGVGMATVAEVFARIVMAAPAAVPQVDIANGVTLPGLAELPQGSVSRASKLLLNLNLLIQKPRRVERPGRPIVPLELGPDWVLIGVRIHRRRGRPTKVTGALAPLDGTRIDKQFSADIHETADHEALVKKIAYVVRKLRKDDQREVLGVGVELGDHVHQGSVITPARTGDTFPLEERLSQALPDLPTVVENDVKAQAALQIWRKDSDSDLLRFPQPEFAVVAVFEERAGGALVVDRKIYRGHHGLAGEIGHLTVDYARPQRQSAVRPQGAASDTKGFNDPCLCADLSGAGSGGYGHVDALATPARIAGELGLEISQLNEAAREPAMDETGGTSRTGEVFRIAGEALGRGIAAMVNIANPGNLLVLLPPVLAEAAAGTAADQYRQAIEVALDRGCFPAVAADARAGRPGLQIESMGPDDLKEARPARACVLDSFIAHARGAAAESLVGAGGID
jgi:predicted NBD/HSP70 family sugar kinase